MRYNKILYRPIFVFTGLLMSFFSSAQTVELKAEGIKECLINNYPELLDADDKLDTVAAKSITTELNCSGKNVVYLDDLKYFTAVGKLTFNNNEIIDITPIKSLNQIVSINFTSNEIDVFPDFEDFWSLGEFKANYNQFDSLPKFNSSIQRISFGNNSLSGKIDLSNYPQLTEISLFENDIKEIVGFENLGQVKTLNLKNNKLSKPKDLTGLVNLKHIDLSKNLYTDLPKLLYTNLEYVNISSNQLSFEDLLPFSPLNLETDSFPDYISQAQLESTQTDSVALGSPWTWALSFDQDVETNIYHWFKNSEEIKTSIEGIFTIETSTLADSGVYHCEIENTLPNINVGRLTTKTRTLGIKPAPLYTKIEIPDSAFRECLIEQFPDIFNSEKQLLQEKAKLVTNDLSCANRNIKSIAGLENFKSILNVKLDSNQIDSLPNLTALSELKHLSVASNLLENLPELTADKLEYLNVSFNALSFEDILPFSSLSLTTDSFPNYSQQAMLDKERNSEFTEGDSWTWKLNFDKALTNNTYHWFKDGDEIQNTTIGELTIDPISMQDAGKYRCEIENTVLNQGRLMTFSQTVSVSKKVDPIPECFTIDHITVTSTPTPCQSRAVISIDLSATNLQGEPYFIIGKDTSFANELEIHEEGRQDLMISDNACSQTLSNKIDVSFDLRNCEPSSFSPNGDGLDDTFYLDFSGNGSIYNSRGEIVRQLTLPAEWDGILNDGSLADTGLYIIIINGKDKVSVTLLR